MNNRKCISWIAVIALCLSAMFCLSCQKPTEVVGQGPVIAPTTFRASVVIDAPVDEAFDYVADFNTLKDYYPGIESISVEGEGLGAVLTWTVQVNGQSFDGESVIIDFVPDQMISGMSPEGEAWTYVFLPAPEGGTKLMLVAQFFPSLPDGSSEARQKMTKETQDHLQLMLDNLKAEIEK